MASLAVTLPLAALSPSALLCRTGCTYAALTLAFSPLTQPSIVSRLARGLQLPLVVEALLLRLLRPLHTLRERHTLAVLLAHEVITDITADIMAQAVAANGAAVELDWRRVPKSTISALLSDDFPFILWSKYLWSASERLVARIRQSQMHPKAIKLLTSPVSVTLAKTAVTQVVYETTSNTVYLSMQALLRGGGWPGVVAEMKGKFLEVWRDGLIFWSMAHIVVFSMPIWWMQPIADNFFTLLFNAYLAYVSNRAL